MANDNISNMTKAEIDALISNTNKLIVLSNKNNESLQKQLDLVKKNQQEAIKNGKADAKYAKEQLRIAAAIGENSKEAGKLASKLGMLKHTRETAFEGWEDDVKNISKAIGKIPIESLDSKLKKHGSTVKDLGRDLVKQMQKGGQHIELERELGNLTILSAGNVEKIADHREDELRTLGPIKETKELIEKADESDAVNVANMARNLLEIFKTQEKISTSADKMASSFERGKREIKEYTRQIPILSNYVENWVDKIKEKSFMGAVLAADEKAMNGFKKAMGAAVGFGVMFIKTMKEISNAIRDTSTELGLSLKNSEWLVKSSRNWATETDTLLDNYRDVLDSQKALTKEMGFMERDKEKRFKMINQMQTLNTEFGVSYEAGAKLIKQFTRMGSSLEETEKIGLIASNLANSTNMAVNLNEVIEDISSNSASIYTYFKGGPMAIAKQVIAMKRLGMAVSDVISSTESIMDIESSLEKQMIAQVMLGREFNLDKARSLALSGDIEGSMDEILSKMGSAKDFNDMDFLQKQAVAEATGYTVDKLQEALYNQEKLTEMTAEQRAEHRGYLDQMENMKRLSKEEILQQGKGQVAALKFGKAWDNIILSIQQGFLPMIEAAEPLIEKIANFMNYISGAFKFIGKMLPGLIAAFMVWKTIQAVIAVHAAAAAIANIASASAKSWGIAIPVILGATALGVGTLFNLLGKTKSVGDAVITSKGEVIHTSPDDYIMATKDPGSIRETITDSVINNTAGGQTSTETTNINNTVQTNNLEKKLDTLIALFTEVKNGMKQPIYLQVNNGAITKIGDAISLRKNMISGVDRGYGKILTT